VSAKDATLRWRAKNRDKVLAQKKRYNEKHREKIAAWKQAWHQRRLLDPVYRETHRAALKAWNDAHPEQGRARIDRYQERHPERVKATFDRWRKNNPIRAAAGPARRRARIAGAAGDLTPAQAEELFEEYRGFCAYCPARATTIDHVVPLAEGGEHMKDNCVPACSFCNSSKKNRPLLVWLATRKRRSLHAVHG
jgi:5-methylcytosine-specific restriction endonuclease McrA